MLVINGGYRDATACTVEELIDWLSEFDRESQVYINSNGTLLPVVWRSLGGEATDCTTYCRRNRSLERFKRWLKREVEICGEYARYSVSDFQNRCSDYRSRKEN